MIPPHLYQQTPADRPKESPWAVISLGSNIPGDKGTAIIVQAIQWLTSTYRKVAQSHIYTTLPLSGTGPDYTNAVAVVECSPDTTAATLQDSCKRYELECGRDEKARERGEVVIDLDVVFFAEDCLRPGEIGHEYFRKGFSECLAQMK